MRTRWCRRLTAVLTGGVCACSGPDYGVRLLDDLRAQGLIVDDSGSPAPAPSLAERESAVVERGSLSLDALLAIADANHPRLAAARAAIGATGARAWQESLPPNPEVEVESENVRPSDGGFGVSETTVRVAQPLFSERRRSAAVEAGLAEIERERFAVEEVRREIHAAIRRIVVETAFDREAIEHYDRLIEAAGESLRIAEARLSAGAAPETEAIRFRVEVNSLALARDRLRGTLAVAAEELRTALGGVAIEFDRVEWPSTAKVAQRPPAPLEALEAEIARSHPAILRARAEVEAARRRVAVAEALARAEPTARLGVGVDHADDEAFIEAGVSVPLTISDRNQGAVLAARFEVIRLLREAEAVENEQRGALARAWRVWESECDRLDAFESQILSGARRAHEQTRVAYEAGRVPLLDLLDAQRTLMEATLSQVELRRAVGVALSEVNSILGREVTASSEPQTGELP